MWVNVENQRAEHAQADPYLKALFHSTKPIANSNSKSELELRLTVKRISNTCLSIPLRINVKLQCAKFRKFAAMNVKIEPSWAQRLQSEFDAPYFQQLTQFVHSEYSTVACYPPGPEIFNAFNLCPFDKIKVVIIGQDPYHEPGQAEGLCFSVKDGVKMPPSLVNIFKEIQDDMGRPFPTTGSLRRWAEQGVLLLNATLTVRAHQAGSHQGKGWETFTDAVIRHLSAEREHLVFILWGSYAQRKGQVIDRTKHLVLTSAHPSPLSAYRGFFGNHHFTLCNDYLIRNGVNPITW